MDIGKQQGDQRRKVQPARSRRLCHVLLSHLLPQQRQQKYTPEATKIQPTDLWTIRIDEEMPKSYPLLRPD
jgi:hypothetical protein